MFKTENNNLLKNYAEGYLDDLNAFFKLFTYMR